MRARARHRSSASMQVTERGGLSSRHGMGTLPQASVSFEGRQAVSFQARSFPDRRDVRAVPLRCRAWARDRRRRDRAGRAGRRRSRRGRRPARRHPLAWTSHRRAVRLSGCPPERAEHRDRDGGGRRAGYPGCVSSSPAWARRAWTPPGRSGGSASAMPRRRSTRARAATSGRTSCLPVDLQEQAGGERSPRNVPGHNADVFDLRRAAEILAAGRKRWI
jgi:hypothetical protein